MAAPVRARLGESVAAARGQKKVRFIALMARVGIFGSYFLRRPATVFSDFRWKIRCRNLDAVVRWKQVCPANRSGVVEISSPSGVRRRPS